MPEGNHRFKVLERTAGALGHSPVTSRERNSKGVSSSKEINKKFLNKDKNKIENYKEVREVLKSKPGEPYMEELDGATFSWETYHNSAWFMLKPVVTKKEVLEISSDVRNFSEFETAINNASENTSTVSEVYINISIEDLKVAIVKSDLFDEKYDAVALTTTQQNAILASEGFELPADFSTWTGR